jgi:PhnB protein
VRVDPYLYFHDRCEEALAFYRGAIGAEGAVLARFGDIPGATVAPGGEARVAHAMLRFGDTTVLASDGRQDAAPGTFNSFSLCLAAADDAETERLFAALADGGQVQLPLMSTPFASRMGIVADRFGVPWMVITQSQGGNP